eukprot:143753_1
MAEQKQQESKKLLMLCGDFGEDYETMVPYQTLSAAGYEVHCVCPEKKKDDNIKTSVHDFEGAQTYSEKPGHNFKLNYDFNDAVSNVKQYVGLVIPGGRAPEYLSVRKDVIDLVTHFTSNNLPIAAICHGPLILSAIDGYLKGKEATCYPACKPALDVSGATFKEAKPVTTCFTDGKLVTGAAWPAHPEFCSQFMTVLGAKIESKSKKKVLVIAGDFVEDYEIMCPFQMLLAFGIDVDVVSPSKKKDDKIKTAIHDFEGDQTYTEKVGHNFVLNATFDEVKVDDYDALYIPGGRAPEYLSIDKSVLSMVQEFAKKKKVISHVCHGVLVLAAAGVLKGRKTRAYPACSPVVKICGAEYVEAEPMTGAFTDQGNDDEYTLVSGAAWPAHIELVKQLIKELGLTITV